MSCGDLVRQRLLKTLPTDLKLITDYFIYMVVFYICMSLYQVPVCYTLRPEKGTGPPGPGVIDGSELPVGVLRIKPESSRRIVSGLNCWVISLAPQ